MRIVAPPLAIRTSEGVGSGSVITPAGAELLLAVDVEEVEAGIDAGGESGRSWATVPSD